MKQQPAGATTLAGLFYTVIRTRIPNPRAHRREKVRDFTLDMPFSDIISLNERALLFSTTTHGKELDYMRALYESGRMTTAGENINALEELSAAHVSTGHAVALASGTAALHLAVKLAAEKHYGSPSGISTPDGLDPEGSLMGRGILFRPEHPEGLSDLSISMNLEGIPNNVSIGD